jgi:hypothetical protein
LALRPKFEGNNLRSKDPSYITAPTPGLHRQNSNRESKLLETDVTVTKHSPDTCSNREETRVSPPPFSPPRRPSTSRCTTNLASASKTGAPKNAPKQRKRQKCHTPFMFRLKLYPTLCFVQVRSSFNRTMFRLLTRTKRTKIERRNDQPARRKAKTKTKRDPSP